MYTHYLHRKAFLNSHFLKIYFIFWLLLFFSFNLFDFLNSPRQNAVNTAKYQDLSIKGSRRERGHSASAWNKLTTEWNVKIKFNIFRCLNALSKRSCIRPTNSHESSQKTFSVSLSSISPSLFLIKLRGVGANSQCFCCLADILFFSF